MIDKKTVEVEVYREVNGEVQLVKEQWYESNHTANVKAASINVGLWRPPSSIEDNIESFKVQLAMMNDEIEEIKENMGCVSELLKEAIMKLESSR